jgi:hypothetical protein
MNDACKFGAVVVALLASSSVASRSHCDPSLAPSTNNPFGYIDRGDRCEGVYIQVVGGTMLTLLSFTSAFDSLDPTPAVPVVIEWAAPPGTRDVHLRALSMQRRLFYRMDTSIQTGSTRYRWPTDVLAAVNLAPANIGLLGWTRLAVGGAEQDVYLPLVASQGNPRAAPGSYTVLVRPAVELSELFLTVTRLADDGSPGRVMQPSHELGYGYYPAENTIEVSVDAPAERGLYAVHLGARVRSGGASTLQFIVLAPGR